MQADTQMFMHVLCVHKNIEVYVQPVDMGFGVQA